MLLAIRTLSNVGIKQEDENMKKYLSAIIISLLLTTTLFATQATQKIEIIMNAITIMVNGQTVEADNILYNGTTYVPLRAVSELLDKEVNFKKETNSVEINDMNITDKDIQKQNPIVTMTMENGEQVKIELYPEIAPNTVNNFISLINQGFYNGLNFHRVIPGFMIQGGDPAGNGSGGPGYGIEGEFSKNGIENNLIHTRGILSMARAQNPNSGGSQFFIVVEDSLSLDGAYAAFGEVIEGMDVVDQIVNVATDINDKPLEPQAIKTMSVELFGQDYQAPSVIK